MNYIKIITFIIKNNCCSLHFFLIFLVKRTINERDSNIKLGFANKLYYDCSSLFSLKMKCITIIIHYFPSCRYLIWLQTLLLLFPFRSSLTVVDFCTFVFISNNYYWYIFWPILRLLWNELPCSEFFIHAIEILMVVILVVDLVLISG